MTLTQAAYWTRRFGVLGIGAFAVFIIVTIVLVSLPKKNAPSEYLTPTFACTETKDLFLPNKLSIPSLSIDPTSDLVFEIETETGKVDALPRIINVHKYANLGQSLNSQGEAKILAGKLGFEPDAIQRRGSAEYVWTNSLRYQTLVVDARTLNFTVSTDFSKSGSINNELSLPSDSEAIQIATSYLQGKSLLMEDYTQQEPQIVYVNIQPNGTLTQARSKVDAELIRVDFYRKASMISIRSDLEGADNMKVDLEKKLFEATTETMLTDKGRIEVFNFDTIVTFQNPNEPNISIYVGPDNKADKNTSDNTNRSVYGAKYTMWPLEPLSCGTYQLIAPSTALELVQNGKGSLVYLNEKNGDDVVAYTPKKVRKFTIYTITLGYYESKAEQKFLQPIYIISGEATLESGIIGKFHYYVPAIDYDAVGDKVVIEETPQEETSILGN